MRIIVLGAGIAGIAAAQQLVGKGFEVLVLDEGSQIGGTHRSHEIGDFTFDIGSIFYESNASIFNLADGLRDLCQPVRRIQRRIDQEGSLLHHPIEPRDLMRWPRRLQFFAVYDLLIHRFTQPLDGSLEAICRKQLGSTIYEKTGLRDYITRFNHISPVELDEEFFSQRMAQIARASSYRNLAASLGKLLKGSNVIPMLRPPMYVRPRAGFATFFAPVQASLEKKGVRFALGQRVREIIIQKDQAFVQTTSDAYHCDAIVGAMPLDTLFQALFSQPSGLDSLSLMTLFISAGDLHPETGNVLYNFDCRGRWKRATIYSRIYSEAKSSRAFFSAEITLAPDKFPDPEAAFVDLVSHFRSLGIAQDMQLEGSTFTPFAYPLYKKGSSNLAKQVRDQVTSAGIIPAGRQGEFEYLPTSSLVISRVAKALAAQIPNRFDED